MELRLQGDTLVVGGLRELSSANAMSFRDRIRLTMSDSLRNIEIDLSQATFLDSHGLGALIALRNTAHSRHGFVRLVDPCSCVLQILEVTRLRRVFEITPASPHAEIALTRPNASTPPEPGRLAEGQ